MAAFTRTRRGEVTEGHVVEWLRGMVVTASVMRFQEEGEVGRIAREIDGTLCAPHSDKANAVFVTLRKADSVGMLVRIARSGRDAN